MHVFPVPSAIERSKRRAGLDNNNNRSCICPTETTLVAIFLVNLIMAPPDPSFAYFSLFYAITAVFAIMHL